MWFERNVMYSVIYDLSVLTVSRMGFQKKKNWIGGWVGGLSSIQFFFDFWNFFYFAKPLSPVATLSTYFCEKCRPLLFVGLLGNHADL